MDQKGEGGIRGEGSISEARGHFDRGGWLLWGQVLDVDNN